MGYFVFLYSKSINEHFLPTDYNSGAVAICRTLQLKGETKLLYYCSARICKVTLDVSHSPEELLSYYIFVFPPAQELKMDFLLDWKLKFKKVMTIFDKSKAVILLLPASCSLAPHIIVRSSNQIECWETLCIPGVTIHLLNDTFFPTSAPKPEGNSSTELEEVGLASFLASIRGISLDFWWLIRFKESTEASL